MHILAVDFGTKRIGLAWADTSLGVVLPYGVIEEASFIKKVDALAQLIVSDHIDRVTMGYPLGLDGRENKNTERVKKFTFELQKRCQTPIDYTDERFSSQAADKLEAGASRDEKAAMLVLESYLERQKK